MRTSSDSTDEHGRRVLRVGIVGLGQASGLVLNWERQDFRTLPVRFTAAADLREEALARFRTEYDAEGYTDYLIAPLRFGDGTLNTLSIATKELKGLWDHDLDWFRHSIDPDGRICRDVPTGA